MIEKIVTGDFQTNTYLIVHNDHCVIIDPGLDFLEEAQRIKEKYIVDKILLTHGHLDHIDGIRYFSTDIYISALEKDFLFDDSLSLYSHFNRKNDFKDLKISLLADGDTLDIFGYPLKVIHTPGHTKGSVVFSYRDKLFSGDTLFQSDVGRCDLPTGNSKSLDDSLIKIFKMFNDQVVVYPGHGEKTSIKHERKNNRRYNYIIKKAK